MFEVEHSIVPREFVQISFLKELYEEKFSNKVFFKGGTAIRLLYGGKRFSEDLDFTVLLDEGDFQEQISRLFSKLENQYPLKFKEKKTITGKTYLLTAILPFLKNNVYVKLDFSLRENVIQQEKEILKTEYPVVVQSFINCLSKDEILAEKIRAVLKREKHRDLYDLWILQELGAKVDISLITEMLKYYNEDFDKDELMQRLKAFTKEGFVKDLRPFVPINEREARGVV
ncbi:hypothetical protein GF357_01975 [Candidatus Dojkabacteria bacterium]|nr:hypothetical protein [Candidatus Dojkabacteria bacterium]